MARRGKMTIKELKIQIKELKKLAHNFEASHEFEDNLREKVLKEIAAGNPNSQELAQEVLKTSNINFARWYC